MKTTSFLRRFVPIAAALAAMPACNLMCPYSADQVFETQVRAECHFFFACCTVGEHDVLLATSAAGIDFADMQRFRDEGHCVQERLEEGSDANELFRAIVQAEQAGRFRYDADQAKKCGEGFINALNNCEADVVLGSAAPLEASLECSLDPEAASGDGTAIIPGEGFVVDGDNCFFDFECKIPNSRCLPPIVLAELDDCASDRDCRSDEVCQDNLCVLDLGAIVIADDKICIAPLEEGVDCSQDPKLLFLPSYCDEGLRCIADRDGDVSCELPRIDGESCFSGSGDCERGLYCNAGGSAPKCTELKREGDDCDSSEECQRGLFCDASRNEPSCEAPLKIEVQICDGIQGEQDPKSYDIPFE